MSAVLALAEAASVQSIEVRPLAVRIGAEVRGVKLGGGLQAGVVAQLRAALLRHRVLFFRDQQHLTDAEHQAFGRLWGEIESHPTVSAPADTAFFELDSQHGGRADSWHTDVTFRPAIPRICVLRAITLPPVGGDTVWASTVAGYNSLPTPLKTLAEQLWAVHGNDYDYAENFRNATEASDAERGARAAYRKEFVKKVLEAEHPLVHIHPETGEKALLLGHFAKKLKGLRSTESTALLHLFHERITRLENTVRWSWREGDVAMWDNRATQHYAINDYGDAHRVVRRVTVSGERAVAVDGRTSVDLSPAP